MLVATGASSSSIVDTVLMLSDTFLPASLTVILRMIFLMFRPADFDLRGTSSAVADKLVSIKLRYS